MQDIQQLGRRATFGLTLILVGTAVAGIWIYWANAPNLELIGGKSIADLELAGSAPRATELVGDPVQSSAAEALVSDVRSALYWDVALILGLGIGIVGACLLGRHLFLGRAARRLAGGGVAAGLVAALCDVFENGLLLWGLPSPGAIENDLAFQAAAAFASVKFALLLVAAPIAIIAVPVVLTRTIVGNGKHKSDYSDKRGDILLPWPSVNSKGSRWPPASSGMSRQSAADDPGSDHNIFCRKKRKRHPVHAHHRYSYLLPEGRRPAEVGFCVSGGGIRSAAVALGAFQSLRSSLRKARYLVSVSGGGYAAGALQLALRDPALNDQGTEPVSMATVADVYDCGTVEEDHTRRHGCYIADGPGEWVSALLTILRGLLVSLSIMSATIIVAGLALSHFYKHIAYVDLNQLATYLTHAECSPSPCKSPAFPVAQGYAGWTVMWLGLAALLVWIVSVALTDAHDSSRGRTWLQKIGGSLTLVLSLFAVLIFVISGDVWESTLITRIGLAALLVWIVSVALIYAHDSSRGRRRLQKIGRSLTLVSSLLAVLIFVIPAVVWGSTYITWLARAQGTHGADPRGAIGGAAGALLLTYLATLASILWRARKQIGTTVSKVGGLFGRRTTEKDGVTTLVPHGLIQYVIVWAALTVLMASGLMLLSITTITGIDWNRGFQWGIPAGLLVVYILVDQTWISLHPFYRRRLASAFSVRRVLLPDGDVAARAYDFDDEATPLSTYGKKREGFPQVIFACAANLTGADRTPPGRRAVSYTLSHDHVGGPDVGYIPTPLLQKALSGPLQADLTVQAAVAISGAAFASAMGRQATVFQTLLAISNARLGTWLPNPAYLNELAAEDAYWWLPPMPRIRRLTYLWREIFGRLPHSNQLLLVTDGGHYDNLGLVELLRHRCRTIYCIDASGDSPPFPQTLHEAVTLAWEELGIKITLPKHLELLPGSADPLKPVDPLKSLSARLSKTAVIVGKIEYPEPFRVDGGNLNRTGKLIFAKALLTADMPSELLAYAQSRTAFPRDGTGDQWFTHDQFDAYQGLGQFIGKKASEISH